MLFDLSLTTSMYKRAKTNQSGVRMFFKALSPLLSRAITQYLGAYSNSCVKQQTTKSISLATRTVHATLNVHHAEYSTTSTCLCLLYSTSDTYLPTTTKQ